MRRRVRDRARPRGCHGPAVTGTGRVSACPARGEPRPRALGRPAHRELLGTVETPLPASSSTSILFTGHRGIKAALRSLMHMRAAMEPCRSSGGNSGSRGTQRGPYVETLVPGPGSGVWPSRAAGGLSRGRTLTEVQVEGRTKERVSTVAATADEPLIRGRGHKRESQVSINTKGEQSRGHCPHGGRLHRAQKRARETGPRVPVLHEPPGPRHLLQISLRPWHKEYATRRARSPGGTSEPPERGTGPCCAPRAPRTFPRACLDHPENNLLKLAQGTQGQQLKDMGSEGRRKPTPGCGPRELPRPG